MAVPAAAAGRARLPLRSVLSSCSLADVGRRRGKRGRAGGKQARTLELPPAQWLRLAHTLAVPLQSDPGQHAGNAVSAALLDALAAKLKLDAPLEREDVRVVRKSFDARRTRNSAPLSWQYVVDIRNDALARRIAKSSKAQRKCRTLVDSKGLAPAVDGTATGNWVDAPPTAAPPVPSASRGDVVIIGAGPCGLFAALALTRLARNDNLPPPRITLVERGEPVEGRGKAIGALFHRRVLDATSNLCYGEGGAGTWSDGKLTTRIGRNGGDVRAVLHALVDHGAPERILVDGKPHLGTDRLVRILRSLRAELEASGVEILWQTDAERVVIDGGRPAGVLCRLQGADDARLIPASQVVVAVGHSSRAFVRQLAKDGVSLEAKEFAVGFRVEHEQGWLDEVQYGEDAAALVERGRGRVPVADYRVTASPVTAVEHDTSPRGVYSFCMCPGGQIVPTATVEDELCVNGMSFSKRGGLFCNSAVVATVRPSDVAEFAKHAGIEDDGGGGIAFKDPGTWDALRGFALQEAWEREAARRGGAHLACPVMPCEDYAMGRSTPLPGGPSGRRGERTSGYASSYRLGVTPTNLLGLYPPELEAAIQGALVDFDRTLPGFVRGGLLHGVETRTSSPVCIRRDDRTLAALPGLRPAGEGAGFAGGIVSAAVDGTRVAHAVHHALAESER